jgi:hypothetical protein
MSPAVATRFVPERTGPLLRSKRADDDELLEEIFGPDESGGPGAFDMVLIAAGAGLLIWGLLAGLVALDVFGGIALLLGLVLPMRSLASRRKQRRQPGLPLDAGDPLVSRLVAASDQIFADTSPAHVVAQPVTHLAAVEVATLLKGQPPGGPAQSAYVSERVELLERLAKRLNEQPELLAPPDDPREAEALGLLELQSGQNPSHSSLEVLRRLTRGDDQP